MLKKLHTKLTSDGIISKQDFLKQIEKIIESEPTLKNIQQKGIVKNLKAFYFLLYILGIIIMCLVIEFPKIENNANIILLIGDYIGFIIPVLVIPMLPVLLVCGLFAELFEEKLKTNFTPIIYSMLSIKEIKKDKKTIEKIGDIGLFPGHTYRIGNSFEILKGKYHIIVQEIETSNNNDQTLFWGPIITFSLNFSYHTTTLVLDKDITKTSFKFQNDTRKKMEKITFIGTKLMDKYQVFGLDKTKTRLILTSEMMKKIKKLREIYHSPMNILFINNKIILAIDTNKDMFEFFDFEKQVIKEKCANFYDEIQALFEFQNLY